MSSLLQLIIFKPIIHIFKLFLALQSSSIKSKFNRAGSQHSLSVLFLFNSKNQAIKNLDHDLIGIDRDIERWTDMSLNGHSQRANKVISTKTICKAFQTLLQNTSKKICLFTQNISVERETDIW